MDAGAARVLRERNASLLPSGITAVEGAFDRGATVTIRDAAGAPIATGVTLYSSAEIGRIAGQRSDRIESILGYSLAHEVVHRDDLALAR